MKKRDIESTLKSAFEHVTPDLSDRIIADCGNQKREVKMNTVSKNTAKSKNTSYAGRRHVFAYIAAAAAVLALLVTGTIGFTAYRSSHAVAYTVSLDVNPSVEITVNSQEKVLSVIPHNEDGKIIVGTMDFTGSSLDVTVNALVGSMLRNGYLNELSNSILITVQGENADALRERLAKEVNAYLENGTFLASVVSFTDEGNSGDELQTIAQTYDISRGKAKLIQALMSLNPQYTESELSNLSVNELNLLLEKAEVMPDTSLSWNGEASTKAYIGEEEAETIALAHAGAAREKAVFTEVTDLDYEDGVMVYEVEFSFEGIEYDYEINALTGEILKNNREADDSAPVNNANETSSGTQIGLDRAKAIALGDAGIVPTEAAFTKTEKDTDDGRTVYELEFTAAGYEFDYEIDAESGKILKREKESLDNGQTESATGTQGDVGLEQAVSTALNHAGVSGKDVTFTKKQKDTDDGRTVYEIDFVYAGTEYEYEIDAASGKILKSEKEASESRTETASGTQGDIGLDEAVRIALEHAGVNEKDASFTKKEKDTDDGQIVYDIEFTANGTEYEYEISASTGNILKNEKEKKSSSTTSSSGNSGSGTDSSSYIGASKAKSIALKHAGVSSSNAKSMKCELDKDKGVMVYEVEFYCNGYEYEYEINATTGKIIKAEKEKDD